MSFANQPHPDQPATRDPPVQPMPPVPDLQFVVPPTDPMGMPQQPVAASGPVRHGVKRPSRAARLLALGVVVLIVAGVALLIWLGS